MELTVNDALISTDIDRLIRFISEKQKTTMKEVQQNTGVDKKIIEKWIKILEDEGYIDIDYRFTNTFFVWKGLTQQKQKMQVPVPETRELNLESNKNNGESKKEVVSEIQEPEPEKIIETKEEVVEENKAPEEPEIQQEQEYSQTEDSVYGAEETSELDIEKLDTDFSEYDKEIEQTTENKEESDNELDMDKLPSEILNDDEEINTVIDSYQEKEIKNEEQTVAPKKIRFPFGDSGDDSDDNSDDKFDLPPEKPDIQAQPISTKQSNQIRGVLNTYLDKVDQEKSELLRLQQKKEKLNRERYAELEQKMEADVVSLTEKILEKEARIAELRERYIELPDKVEEIKTINRKLQDMKDKSLEIMSKNKSKIEMIMVDNSEAQKRAKEKIDEIEGWINNEKAKLDSIENAGEEVDSEVEKLQRQVEETESLMNGLNKKLSNVKLNLDQSNETRETVTRMKEDIQKSIESMKNELDVYTTELEELKSVEDNISEYLEDYEKRIDEINESLDEGEQELNEVRAAAEGEQLNSYLKELDNLIEDYENELEATSKQENEIDEQIGDTKKRLQQLFTDSRRLIRDKNLVSEVEYKKVAGASTERSEKVKKILKDKKDQRRKLMEEDDDDPSEDGESNKFKGISIREPTIKEIVQISSEEQLNERIKEASLFTKDIITEKKKKGKNSIKKENKNDKKTKKKTFNKAKRKK